MTIQRRQMPAIGVEDVPKGKGRIQVAALCWRNRDGGPRILLVTSRDTGRWVLPKGWPIDGLTAAEAAAREAWEEAGIEGKLRKKPLGRFAYHKYLGPEKAVPCVVDIFALKVKSMADNFPESGQRKRKWFTAEEAAARVDEPELKALLRSFAPKGQGDTPQPREH